MRVHETPMCWITVQSIHENFVVNNSWTYPCRRVVSLGNSRSFLRAVASEDFAILVSFAHQPGPSSPWGCYHKWWERESFMIIIYLFMVWNPILRYVKMVYLLDIAKKAQVEWKGYNFPCFGLVRPRQLGIAKCTIFTSLVIQSFLP